MSNDALIHELERKLPDVVADIRAVEKILDERGLTTAPISVYAGDYAKVKALNCLTVFGNHPLVDAGPRRKRPTKIKSEALV